MKRNRTKKFILYLFFINLLLFLVLFFSPVFGFAYIYPFHFGLGLLALYFIYKNSLGETAALLGIPGNLKSNLIYYVGGMVATVILVLTINQIITELNLPNDSMKVAYLIQQLPAYALFAAVVIAPLTEELFFRGFLVSRFGIWLPNILFALSHYTYGSSIQLISTFFMGAALAVVFKKSKSLVPGVFIHMTFNLMSVILITNELY